MDPTGCVSAPRSFCSPPAGRGWVDGSDRLRLSSAFLLLTSCRKGVGGCGGDGRRRRGVCIYMSSVDTVVRTPLRRRIQMSCSNTPTGNGKRTNAAQEMKFLRSQ
jgi:hypothetical protein